MAVPTRPLGLLQDIDPKTLAWYGGLFAPGSGVADASGVYPSLDGQGFHPSLKENISKKQYLDALFQSMGIVGDAVYAATGPIGGTTLGAALKAPGKIQKTIKALPTPKVDTSYRMQHQARGREFDDSIQLDDLTKDISGNRAGYPDDFYSPKGQKIYAPGKRLADDEYGIANTESYNAILKSKNNPEAEITIYRAVPKGINNINEGDFVTLSPKYAELLAESGYGLRGDESGEVISQTVKVKDLIWDATDVNEFGYFPIKE